MKIKLSDYVAQKVVELGISQVFMITGGGAMHLNQSLGRHRDLNVMFNHHEQASTIAAEGYARLVGKPALVNVTTGPGGTNTITGVHGAWTDSIPILVISGQVKTTTIAELNQPELRQLGDQEVGIVDIVSSITKYAVLVNDPYSIRYHLEKAFYLATSRRPGPVWVDIPIDIQSTVIDTLLLQGFTAPSITSGKRLADLEAHSQVIKTALESHSRPVVLLGTGVRVSNMAKNALALVEQLNLPVVTGWNAHDLIPTEHPLFVGKPGTVGDRAGNFAVQNADLLIVMGCRLNIRQISYNWQSFANKARVLMIDVDEQELAKPTLSIDYKLTADLAELIPFLIERPIKLKNKTNEWLKWCIARKLEYPVVQQEYRTSEQLNPYYFMEVLFNTLDESQVVVAGNGSACVIGFQVAKIKSATRLWTNSGSAAMGYDIPAAIGACLGAEGKSVICLAGDGSIMMNLQELETIRGNNLPIKIFIINNGGYSSIYQTHKNFFDGHEVGASTKSGLTLPDFEKLSAGFQIPYFKLAHTEAIQSHVAEVISQSGPLICEVFVDHDQGFAPKLASKQLADGTIVSPSLEDMAPFLSEQELKNNTWSDI